MAGYRSHVTRWHVVKSACLLAFGAALLFYNAFIVLSGLGSGAVKSLSRRSNSFVRYDTDPGWFVYNICFRTFMSAVAAVVVAILWRKLQEERADGFVQ